MKKMSTAAMREANGGLGYTVYCPCGNKSWAFTKSGAYSKHYKHQRRYLQEDGTLRPDHRGLWTSW